MAEHDRDNVRRSVSAAASDLGGVNGIPKITPRKKPIACRRCHVRKTKCSGGQPCQGCIAVGASDSCLYSLKDRMVKVSESYLQRLVEENKLVKQNTSHVPAAITHSSPQDPAESPAETSVVNPLIEDRAWFVPFTTIDLPIYVGEAACAAFTTRLRQALDTSSGRAAHIPRVHFISDEHVIADPHNIPQWPSKVKAQLYVKVAMAYVGKVYHIILISATLKRLDQIYQDMSCVTAIDTCKFFALFALGEVYSNKTKTVHNQAVPGLFYFTAASKMVQTHPERATIQHVENLVLLSFFSHILNRRHSAYHYIVSALSQGMTIGLHHNIPSSIEIDPAVRQHRIRLWWTIYYCDRVWGSKLGHPATIQDSTISVDLPSMTALNDKQKENFTDPEYATASIKLARIVGDTIARIYSRDRTEPFIRNVRSILRDLKDWMAVLPASVKLHQTDTSILAPRNISSIHLSFNQCVILATRPVLLHVLKLSLAKTSSQSTPRPVAITPTISALAETCIHTARHSSDILTQAWINGTLTTFGYFDAHYLFSSAVILAISSLLNSTSADGSAFETLSQILQTNADNGNLSAAEFSGHLDCVRSSIALHQDQAQTLDPNLGQGAERREEVLGNAQFSTTEMALGETPMQEFLLHTDGGEFDYLNPLLGFEEVSFLDPGWIAGGALDLV